MSDMRAVLVKDGKGPVESLFIGSAPRPAPSPTEILVKVSRKPAIYGASALHGYLRLIRLPQIKAFGLNRMDILQREGRYPLPKGASTILGVEFSGTVAEVGSQVTKHKIGDEVFGITSGVSIRLRCHVVSATCADCFTLDNMKGAYAEFIVVPETHVICKPEHLSWAAAAAIPENWLTGMKAMK